MNIYNRNSLNATLLHLDFMLIDFYHAQKGKKLEEMKIILRQILNSAVHICYILKQIGAKIIIKMNQTSRNP